VAARVVATVMLLQAFEGLSDREACDRLEVDLRWQAAAGVDAGYRALHPTVLVGMPNKLRASARPRRLFEDTKIVARQTGAMMLVDALVKDALAALGVLDGQQLPLPAIEAADLLALVAGQDVEQGADGVFRIARKTTRDQVISTVDTAARHGHKSRNRRFDGYKAHLSVDPDSGLIDEVAATAAHIREPASTIIEKARKRNEAEGPVSGPGPPASPGPFRRPAPGLPTSRQAAGGAITTIAWPLCV
jgi:Transposase domain (DUF772)